MDEGSPTLPQSGRVRMRRHSGTIAAVELMGTNVPSGWFERGIRESCCHHEAQGLCATLDCCRQRLADCRDSGCMVCIEGVPVGTLDSDCCHHHAPGMDSSLFLLARDCALACRAVRRHSFPLLYSWGDRESRGLAARTSL